METGEILQDISLKAEQARRLMAIIDASPFLSTILKRWARVALPDGWLAAGAVAQTVWNHATGRAPGHGIADIDIVYFDGTDLSEAAEAAHAARIGALFADLPFRFDVKNEARVHLWYAAKFGEPIEPYVSTPDAISTFPTTATTVGIRPGDGTPEIEAPYGLSDLLGLIVRANRKQITREIYEAKIARWSALWPELRVVPWRDD